MILATVASIILFWLPIVVCWALALLGVWGAEQVATTREDAFEVADRNKMLWCGILVLSAIVCLLGARAMFLAVIGMVVIGLYWCDVRPQIRDILNDEYHW